jgi:hypothetical protein
MRQARLERRKDLEALEQKVYLVVKKVIDKADPESLLKMGAPKDEYDSTSAFIAKAIVREGSGGIQLTGLAYIIALVQHIEFEEWTKPMAVHGQHFAIAGKLLPLIPKIKRP